MQEREAINEVLLNINELPLDDTDNVEDINVAIVVDKLLSISRKQVLGQGWYFNELTITLFPNTSNYIVIPNSFLSVDGSSDTDTVTVRDWKLFDKDTLSYIFTEGKEVNVIEDVVFDDIPYNVANYIVKNASLMAYSNIIGDVSGMQSRSIMLKEAKADALRDNASKIDGNVLDSTFATTLLDRTSI